MATSSQRVGGLLERETPSWGIRPVPTNLRSLRATDLAVLWGDLSIGLLVLVSGALLVPALSLPRAFAAIVVGSAIGCVPLALVGVAGAREGVPGMVLFRPALGARGSYVPSIANLVQLVGWTAFEFWAMGSVAATVGRDALGVGSYGFWLTVVAVICTALALAGPVFVVRRWLERFGFWVVLAVAVWVTIKVATAGAFTTLWRAPGAGGLPFWAAVDLVIAMPISWLPLVADFNRFARRPRGSASGTFWSYAAGNVWFYALGALLVVAARSGPDVLDIGTTIAALAGGAVVLVALLVGESDQATANIYSSAVSIQNIVPWLSQRMLIGLVGGAGFVAAALIRNSASVFEYFLFLIGSVFVPLFGVFAAHYFVVARGRYGEAAIFHDAPPGVRSLAFVPWVVGFFLYQWCVPSGPGWWTSAFERVVHGWLHLPVPLLSGATGASIPSFLVAFLLALVLLPRQG